MKASDLKANPDNPRTITDEKREMLRKSLAKFGDLSGVVFNRKTGLLVGGHQRQTVLPPTAEIIIERKLKKPTKTGTIAEGYILVQGERFSYREVSWDQRTERAANIAANQHGGDFDLAKLTQWVKELSDSGLDMDLVGFSKDELEEKFQTSTPGREVNFMAGTAQDQGQIDQKSPIECPHCGESFVPKG